MSKRNLLFLSICFCWISLRSQERAYLKAERQYEQEKYQAVIQLLKPLESKNENENFLLGKANYQLNKDEEALELFEQCVTLDKENAENHYWLGLSNIQALQSDANFFSKAVYAFDAQDALKRAIELKPDHTKARIQLANYYLNAPLIAGGSVSKAKEQAKALMEYDHAAGRKLLASIYLHNEEYDKAEALYLETIERKENSMKVYYQLSLICLKKKDYQQSFAYLERSLQEYPEYKMAHYQYGKLSVLSRSNLEEGERQLKIYLELDQSTNLPADHWAYYRLGQIYFIQDNKIAAKKAFEESIRLKQDFTKAKEELDEFQFD